MKNPTSRSLVFGLVCALVGLGFGLLFSIAFSDGSNDYFWLYIALSSFILGALSWRLLPERFTRHRILSGVIAGVLGSLVAHFATWFFAKLGAYLCGWLDCAISAVQPPTSVLNLLDSIVWMGIMSILVLGWLTSLVGGILGGFYAFFLQKRGLMD